MHTNARPLFIPALALTLSAFALTTTHTSACDCGKSVKTSGAAHHATSSTTTPSASSSTSAEPGQKPSATPRKFPLKGVITDLLPDRSALMVKHEAIPGVMKAMTMMFAVDASVLTTVKKGDAITALMSRRDDEWRLDDIKVIEPTTP